MAEFRKRHADNAAVVTFAYLSPLDIRRGDAVIADRIVSVH